MYVHIVAIVSRTANLLLGKDKKDEILVVIKVRFKESLTCKLVASRDLGINYIYGIIHRSG